MDTFKEINTRIESDNDNLIHKNDVLQIMAKNKQQSPNLRLPVSCKTYDN